MNNSFIRFQSLVDDYDNLVNKKIMIIGIGGVGGFAAESIARTGILNMMIIDKDVVEESNINRQIIALNSTLNLAKVEVMKNRLLDINPNLNLTILKEFVDETNFDLILDEFKPDYVIECIDSMKAKTYIIKKLCETNTKFISSMGTAKKFHPEFLEITKLSKTEYDPIAKKLRKNLRDQRININKINVISSKEKPKDIKMLGSTSFVPSVAGIMMSSFVINDIIKNNNKI